MCFPLVTQVKTPKHGFQYEIDMARSWPSHIVSTMRVLSDQALLHEMGLSSRGLPADSQAQDACAHTVLMLARHVISHRSWIMPKLCTPPFSCAPIASSSALRAATTVQSMRDEWTTLLRWEQMAVQSPAEDLRRGIF